MHLVDGAKPLVAYCAGFLFDLGGMRVALIRKRKPSWMAGRLNAIGGHVEDGESPVEAMVREFQEETGVSTKPGEWHPFCNLTHVPKDKPEGGVVTFFRAFNSVTLDRVRTTTDEAVGIFPARALPMSIMDNLNWLIPLARDAGVSRSQVLDLGR